jgi:hypothetical protein
MPQHIGIVACSAEGAALCYRTICVEGAQLLGPHAHPEVTMHTHSLAEYMECIYRGDWRGVGELMLSSADKLAKTGADFLICPDNTIHQALPPYWAPSSCWARAESWTRLTANRAGSGYAACVMPQTSCHASKARVRSARVAVMRWRGRRKRLLIGS